MDSTIFTTAERIHCTGVGGIGISGLAQLLHREGKHVTGSDRTQSKMTDFLKRRGIAVTIGHGEKQITHDIGLLIYSDAVAKDNSEIVRARALGIPTLSYFEALGEITKYRFTIAVSGTHGKTTTTGMLAKILSDAHLEPTAIIGSIVKDFESNFLGGRKEPFIVEACEYMGHLLELHPNILVITNIELDHTDYFRNLAHAQEEFRMVAGRLSQEGILVTNPHDKSVAPILGGLPCRIVDYTKERIDRLLLHGDFNIQNAQAAKATAKEYAPRLSDALIDASLKLYRGAWRRFEYLGKSKTGALVYDDYAHHPTEVAKTIKMIREIFPKKRIIIAFHPHLFSRTRDFFDEFACALSLADEVVVAPIFAAREKPDPSISHTLLAKKIHPKGDVEARGLDSFEEIRKYLEVAGGPGDIIITMGAGDIYKVAEQLVRHH